MRNTPMRWIEQAESRQVISAALFERAPQAPWASTAAEAAAQWLPRIGAWLATRHPMGLPALQMQPALVRRPERRRVQHVTRW